MGAVSSPAGERVSGVRLAAALIVGSTLEWYDFLVYGAMSALVLGQLFFPPSAPGLASVAAFAVLAVGYVVRPLGGIAFGVIGDRLGRKTALVAAFILMGVTSTAIGLLPTYGQAGLLAPVLLVLLRAVQGAGAGAEFGIASVYAVESAATARKGLFGAYPALGVGLGQLTSVVVLRVVSGSSGPAFFVWAWRVPFLLSVLLVAVGVWVRRSMGETAEFSRVRDRAPRVRLSRVAREEWRGILGIFGANVALAVHSSFYVVFALYYLTQVVGLARDTVLEATLLGSVVELCTIVIGGMLADRFGPRRFCVAALLAAAVTSALFFPLAGTGRPVLVDVAVSACFGTLGLILAPQGALFAGQFRTEVRATGFMLGRETSTALFAGLAPVLATLLFQRAGPLAVACLTVGACIVSAAATLALAGRRDAEAGPTTSGSATMGR